MKAFFFFFCHFEKISLFFCFFCFLFRLVVLKSWLKLIFLSWCLKGNSFSQFEIRFLHLKFVFFIWCLK
ncbi:hypothetical protein HMPREF1425_01558 [Helicobacter pylori GAM71Ai]|nr:hypothetical protein HMPREF1425_01558 [Helicobacter pylori GAM71Ai]